MDEGIRPAALRSFTYTLRQGFPLASPIAVPVTPGRSSIWTDTNIYNEMGIPACKFGPRGERWKIRSEQVEIEEIFRAAQVFALAAATICDWDR